MTVQRWPIVARTMNSAGAAVTRTWLFTASASRCASAEVRFRPTRRSTMRRPAPSVAKFPRSAKRRLPAQRGDGAVAHAVQDNVEDLLHSGLQECSTPGYATESPATPADTPCAADQRSTRTAQPPEQPAAEGAGAHLLRRSRQMHRPVRVDRHPELPTWHGHGDTATRTP